MMLAHPLSVLHSIDYRNEHGNETKSGTDRTTHEYGYHACSDRSAVKEIVTSDEIVAIAHPIRGRRMILACRRLAVPLFAIGESWVAVEHTVIIGTIAAQESVRK